LHQTVHITVLESLCGWSRNVGTIDAKEVTVHVSNNNPTSPSWSERFPGLGMPLSKKPTERGDMVVEVAIKYPSSLDAAQKDALKKILGEGSKANN
jgi:DnaJ family protein B protein 4